MHVADKTIPVFIHPSQFPDRVGRDLLRCLRQRDIASKFHYDSLKQTQRWLTLHEQYSPSRRDAACQRVYQQGFAAASARAKGTRIHVVGLGCGGGQKDARLLSCLQQPGRRLAYTPLDVSVAMSLVARQTILREVGEVECRPVVADLAVTKDWGGILDDASTLPGQRLFTFFGMLPNLEPEWLIPRLRGLIKQNDLLLLSANLAPGDDYEKGVRAILPQYDNPLTQAWLLTFLIDLGVERDDGEMRFTLEPGGGKLDLLRLVARFHFSKTRRIRIQDETISFNTGASIRLFFSYRYTATKAGALLKRARLDLVDQWIIPSGEEGVFLCRAIH